MLVEPPKEISSFFGGFLLVAKAIAVQEEATRAYYEKQLKSLCSEQTPGNRGTQSHEAKENRGTPVLHASRAAKGIAVSLAAFFGCRNAA